MCPNYTRRTDNESNNAIHFLAEVTSTEANSQSEYDLLAVFAKDEQGRRLFQERNRNGHTPFSLALENKRFQLARAMVELSNDSSGNKAVDLGISLRLASNNKMMCKLIRMRDDVLINGSYNRIQFVQEQREMSGYSPMEYAIAVGNFKLAAHIAGSMGLPISQQCFSKYDRLYGNLSTPLAPSKLLSELCEDFPMREWNHTSMINTLEKSQKLHEMMRQ